VTSEKIVYLVLLISLPYTLDYGVPVYRKRSSSTLFLLHKKGCCFCWKERTDRPSNGIARSSEILLNVLGVKIGCEC
jgi:hypothetical protein